MQDNTNQSFNGANDKIKELIFWVIKKKDLLFYIIAAMTLLGVVIYKSKGFISPSTKKTALLMQKTYAEWEKSLDDKIFDNLKRLIKKNPNILSVYQAQIAQKLLWNKDILSLKENLFTKETARKVDRELPFYPEYTYSTILIADEKYKEALSRAKELKIAMKNATKIPVLIAFNLFRIASLEKELNNKEGELSSLQELQNYIQSCKDSKDSMVKDSMKNFIESFVENKIELTDYIVYRISQLR